MHCPKQRYSSAVACSVLFRFCYSGRGQGQGTVIEHTHSGEQALPVPCRTFSRIDIMLPASAFPWVAWTILHCSISGRLGRMAPTEHAPEC